MSFLYGVLGVIAVQVLFAGGFLLGWMARKSYYRPEPPDMTNSEKQKLEDMKAQQEAWRVMQDYSVETAYGMNTEPFGGEKK